MIGPRVLGSMRPITRPKRQNYRWKGSGLPGPRPIFPHILSQRPPGAHAKISSLFVRHSFFFFTAWAWLTTPHPQHRDVTRQTAAEPCLALAPQPSPPCEDEHMSARSKFCAAPWHLSTREDSHPHVFFHLPRIFAAVHLGTDSTDIMFAISFEDIDFDPAPAKLTAPPTDLDFGAPGDFSSFIDPADFAFPEVNNSCPPGCAPFSLQELAPPLEPAPREARLREENSKPRQRMRRTRAHTPPTHAQLPTHVLNPAPLISWSRRTRRSPARSACAL